MAVTDAHLGNLKKQARKLRAELRKCPPTENTNLVCTEIDPPPTLLKSQDGSPLPVYFFSYHGLKCAPMSAFVNDWSISRGVFVFRMHAIWGAETTQLRQMARSYYALRSLSLADSLSERIHEEVSAKRLDFTPDRRELMTFAGKNGVDAGRLREALNDLETTKAVGLAERETKAYRIPGVPRLYVNGRNMIQADMRNFDAGTRADLAALTSKAPSLQCTGTGDAKRVRKT